MNRRTFINAYIYIILYLIKIVTSKHNIDNILSKAQIAESHFRQVQSLSDNFFTNLDTLHGPIKRRSPSLEPVVGHGALLFANRVDIRKIDLETSENTVVTSGLRSAVAIDYDFQKKLVVWSDVLEGRIYSANMDNGESVKTIVKDNIITPDGLAVDWIYGNVYWTDTDRNAISVASLDGKLIKLLFGTNLDEPRAIVVNPLEGWMFWTDWGEQAKIERAGMDGTHRSTIVSRNIRWPNGLAIDFVAKKIYWADARIYILFSSDYDGSNVKVILASATQVNRPFGLDVFEDWLYWTDWELQSIYKVDTLTGKNVQTVASGVYSPMGVRVYHTYKQPTGPNYCGQKNGECSHFCLPAPQVTPGSAKYTCACPDGMVLTDNQQNCTITDAVTTRAPPPPMYSTTSRSTTAKISINPDVSEYDTIRPIIRTTPRTYNRDMAPPKLVPLPRELELTRGERFQLVCLCRYFDYPVGFSWQKDGAAVVETQEVAVRRIDSSSSSLTISALREDSAGNYTCIVSNPGGSDSSTVKLKVLVPPKLVPLRRELQARHGMHIKLVCLCREGEPPFTFSWLKDGAPLVETQEVAVGQFDQFSSLTISALRKDSAGNYTCIVSNRGGSDSTSVKITVLVPPKLLPLHRETEYSHGMRVRLSCSCREGEPPFTFSWLKDGAALVETQEVAVEQFNEFSSILTISDLREDSTGNYTCIVSNQGGSDSTSVKLVLDCDCGENAECEFVDGEKTCSCQDGYEMHNGTCEECDCGEGHSCTFKNGSSVCICAENYYAHNGTCKSCTCAPSERCEIIGGEKFCICKENFIKINNSCIECWCGKGHICNIVDGKKFCLCQEGFADNNGKCEKCNCGAYHKSCEFQNGKKECECHEGYASNNGICQECFCGKNSTCLFENGEKMCFCPEDQQQSNGTCIVWMCLDDTCHRGTCEVNQNGFFCNCEDGYSGHRCDQEALLSQGAIYLISVLSALTLFWVILLLVYIIRKRNRYRHYHHEKLDATMNVLSEENPDSAM